MYMKTKQLVGIRAASVSPTASSGHRVIQKAGGCASLSRILMWCFVTSSLLNAGCINREVELCGSWILYGVNQDTVVSDTDVGFITFRPDGTFLSNYIRRNETEVAAEQSWVTGTWFLDGNNLTLLERNIVRLSYIPDNSPEMTKTEEHYPMSDSQPMDLFQISKGAYGMIITEAEGNKFQMLRLDQGS